MQVQQVRFEDEVLRFIQVFVHVAATHLHEHSEALVNETLTLLQLGQPSADNERQTGEASSYDSAPDHTVQAGEE